MFDLSTDEVTSEPIHRVLAVLSVPLVAQNTVEVASLVIDLFWIGRLSEQAVAAVGLAAPLFSLLLILTIGIPYIGTMILVSQRVGDDDQFGARRAAFNGVALGTVLSLVIGAVAVVAAPALVELMTRIRPGPTQTAVADMTVTYLRVLAVGLVFASVSDAIEGAFVARGDSRAALFISIATVGTILVADPLLIFGVGPIPGFGIAGAAAASVLGFVAGLLVAVGFVYTGRSGGVCSWSAVEIDIGDIRELYDVGLSPTAQQANRRVAEVVVVVLVFWAGGAIGLAAYTVGTRVFSAASIPAQGFQSAVQSVVGQNLGAGESLRAAKTVRVGVLLIAGVLTVLTGVQWAYAGSIVELLAPGIDGATYGLAVRFLRLLAISYPLYGAMYVVQGGFNGASRGEVSFHSSLFQFWGVQIPLAGFVAIGTELGTAGVFAAIAASYIVTAVVLGLYYLNVERAGLFEHAASAVSSASAD